MRWVIKKTDGVWYATCAATGEAIERESQESALDYARERLLAGEATA
jgi:hypothetical protein